MNDRSPLSRVEADALANHAVAWVDRLFVTPDAQLARHVARIWRRIVAATPPDDPSYPTRAANLALALRTLGERLGRLKEVEEAIKLFERLIAATSPDEGMAAALHSDLGAALRIRFDISGDGTDLDRAVAAGRTAVDIGSADDPQYVNFLCNLGASLETGYVRSGDPGLLNEAISVGHQAVGLLPQGHAHRAVLLTELGISLWRRFELTGARFDIDLAVRLSSEAAVASPDHWVVLSNLANVLEGRYQRLGAKGDLDAAVVVGRKAMEASPEEHGEPLGNLGACLLTRFLLDGGLGDLDEAVVCLKRAVEATAPTAPSLPGRLTTLGGALRLRYAATAHERDLSEGIAACERAVQITRELYPAGAPDLAGRLVNLAGALRLRSESTGSPGDLDAAIDAYRAAVGIKAARPSVRIAAARAGSAIAATIRPRTAADLLEQAVWLLPQVAPRQLDGTDQLHALGEVAGLAADAAALVLADTSRPPAQKATLALQLLEAGRGVVIGQTLQMRSDLTALAAAHPELAERFRDVRDRLDEPTQDLVEPIFPRGREEPALGKQDARWALADELSGILQEIRSKDGFARFAQPPTPEEIRQQAECGPVITVNVSAYRSDALILTPVGVESVALDGFSLSELNDRVTEFYTQLDVVRAHESHAVRMAAQGKICSILGWLWDVAAAPVMQALGYGQAHDSIRPWPQVWWVPGGPMALLPLHAAGHHDDDPDDPSRRSVIDRVVSSYTPTIAALRHARERAAEATAARNASALVVAMPFTPGLPPETALPHATRAAALLTQRLSGSLALVEPDPEDANPRLSELPTRTNVLAQVQSFPIVHFACHGVNDPVHPSDSRLLLHDHRTDPFTVTALSGLRLSAQLAYLSACDTALNTRRELADESVHLVSAFQVAGYAHVVGTFWMIDDEEATTVSEDFYSQISALGRLHPERSAMALHEAVRRARASFPTLPASWAAHLHSGA
ncbi:CHAT domain-containing protein [Streptomyces sp. NPDC058464]|uniref:CHAT domain-containing protein n=1 Tax=Streptomyces sp. NPDC058464 TaxID=3346511 RepID=UPI0036528C64